MTRRVTIQTPLGEALQFRQLVGKETLSELFSFEVDLISTSKSIDPKALLGKSATVSVETDSGKRYLNGIITRFGMSGMDHKGYSYRMRMNPWLWLGTRKTDFKIFQNMTAIDVVSDVLAKYGYPLEKRLSRSYRTREYCVQYGESDTAFASRLLESEGVYYYHKHSDGQHVLVLADSIIGSHSPLPGGEVIPFYPPDKLAMADKECFDKWELAQEIKSGQKFLDDYDFKKPRADLAAVRKLPAGHSHDSYEIYEWPGGYTEYDDGDTYVRVGIEESLSGQSIIEGEANHRCLATGYTFTLKNYPRDDQNQKYLLTSVEYHFRENPQVSDAGGEVGSTQRFRVTAQPTSLAYRPAVVTPQPRTTGPQTAVVVGPPGEEIWLDKFGRAKVQFFWDRIGAMDDKSTCWIRVSTSWAGSNFGMVFHPRVGMEVIVDFLSGNPDAPIITGCVYNADRMPPWTLPGNSTQSGILTRSSKGGAPGAGMKDGAGDANAIRFEDKAGAEQLWLHAQKDQLTEVENDEDKWVGQDRRKTIDRDETNHIKRDRTETVDRNEKITVHGWRTEEVDGDETITIHSNRTERVDHDEKISIGDNRNEDVGIDENITIGKNRSKTIGKSETDKISKNWTINVGMLKTQTIGIGYMHNVGVFQMNNIGVVYNLNVGLMMMTNVGMNRSDNVGMDWSRKIGKNRSATVGENDSLSVTKNQSIDVGADHALKVTDNSLIQTGKELALEAATTLKADGKDVVVTGASSIKLQCGSSLINMTPGMIEIKAPLVKINT